MTGRSRRSAWDDPGAFAAGAAGRSGPDVLRVLVAGELLRAPVSPPSTTTTPIGTVHAGFALTLLDSAVGCALVTRLDAAAVPWTTREVKGNFTRPLTSASGTVRCTGTVVHGGRSVATTEARLEDAAGRLCAHGTSTIPIRR